jgi:hypothetical protein
MANASTTSPTSPKNKSPIRTSIAPEKEPTLKKEMALKKVVAERMKKEVRLPSLIPLSIAMPFHHLLLQDKMREIRGMNELEK